MVTRFPAVPETVHPDTVVVVPAVNRKLVGETPLAIDPNVLDPVIVSAPAPSFDRVQLKVDEAPTKVFAVAAVMLILPVPVPATVEKPVEAALLKAVVEAAGQTRVPPLKVRTFVPAAVV
jgi:hypothetical protein